MKNGLRPFLIAVGVAVTLAGCSRKETTVEINSVADLKGRHCGIVTGSIMSEIVEKAQSGVVFDAFNDYPSMMEALRLGKIDAVPLDTVILRRWAANAPGEFKVVASFADNPYGYFFPKGSPLRAQVNAILAKMKDAGKLDQIVAKWCDAPSMDDIRPEPYPHNQNFTGRNGTLRFATTGDYEPGSFIRNGEVVGFDIDIVKWIASELDMEFKVINITVSALVPAVQSGKADMGGGCVTISASRAEVVDFSDCYLNDGFSLMVKAPSRKRGSDGDSGVAAFAKSLKESFIRTFVTESRWKMLANGFGVTLFITILSVVFATLLAFPVWWARSSSNIFVSAVAKGYIAFMQGTPLLVFLMVLFYIVFGRVDIDGIWIAVIGFSLNASAYIGEVLRSGIESVPYGQTEAALALGYTKWQAFFRFVLPQAVRSILPVYRGQVVILLKNTSIVGYIAIGDLTKASDIVRSRTYESFFPIITTAIIYFVASWFLAFVLDCWGRRLDPANGRKQKGGVA